MNNCYPYQKNNKCDNLDCNSCNRFYILETNNLPERVINFADFYALMPTDNPATIAPGTDVNFPQDGATNGTSITRLSDNSFNISEIGTYEIYFNVPVTEAGQLELTLNGNSLDYTVVGRATGTSNISGLTLTPFAGGTIPVSAHLIIKQIS